MLGSQPSSNMTHRSEELGNTANVDEKYTRDTYMQFVCQFLTALNIFLNGLHSKVGDSENFNMQLATCSWW